LFGGNVLRRPTGGARAAVKTNIVHINIRLEETDLRVRMVPPRSGFYRLVSAKHQRIKIGGAP
jgi:hypothetical protein